MMNKINDFKNRKMKARDLFDIKVVDKREAKEIIKKFHYLKEKDFMYTTAYGLYLKDNDELMGCAVFGVVGGALALKGWFGLDNTHSNEFFELTRLVMNPILNGCNATSYLLGNAIKEIKKNFPKIRGIISIADIVGVEGFGLRFTDEELAKKNISSDMVGEMRVSYFEEY